MYHHKRFFMLSALGVGIVAILSLVFVVYRGQETSLVSRVLYDTGSLLLYDDPVFYTEVSNYYLKTSYRDLKLFKEESIAKKVRKQFPFVSSIAIKSFSHQSLLLHLSFSYPELIVVLGDKRFALYPHYILPLYTGNLLGQTAYPLYLPSYLSGSEYISGLLYMQSYQKLFDDIRKIRTLSIHGSLTYVPGGEKYIYWTEDRHIYFNAKKELSGQIAQLQQMITYYSGFASLRKIDIGSSDLIVIQ